MKVTNINGIMTPGIHTIEQGNLPVEMQMSPNSDKVVGIFARMSYDQCPICGKDGSLVTIKLDGDLAFERQVCLTDVEHNSDWKAI